jgi:hypothetical protein
MDKQSNTHARNDTNKLSTNQSESLLKQRTLHDRQSYMEKKMTESTPFFRTTRVQTCSHVMMKNGRAIAVAFPLEKTGWKNPNAYGNVKRSSEVDSWSK